MAAATSSDILTRIFHSLSSIETSESRSANDMAGPKSPLSLLKDDHLATAKNALLTLHFLFPHELLPALDLLDRGLVKQLKYSQALHDDKSTLARRAFTDADLARGSSVDSQKVHQQLRRSQVSPSHQTSMTAAELEIFYVQSASATRGQHQAGGRFRNAWQGNATKMYYEVRLDSWNCSCAAFAQSQLKAVLQQPASKDTRNLPAPEFGHSNENAELRQSGPKAYKVEGDKHEHQRKLLFGGSLTKYDMPIPICKHILAAAIATAAPDIFAKGITHVDVCLAELSGWAAGWGEI